MKDEKKMPYVCLYREYIDTFSFLSDASIGRLVRAMLMHLAGEEVTLAGKEKILWPQIRNKIDRDMDAYCKRCEKNRINGAKGGRKKATASDGNQTPPN